MKELAGGQVELVVVQTAADMARALSVRRRVFIEEQGVPESLEVDEHDGEPSAVATAVHVLGLLDGDAVATGRLLLDGPPDEYAHVGRVAVLLDQRRCGIGRQVMSALHDLARERGYAGITLAAQLHAAGFYERLGYQLRGDVFLDAGIEHRWADLEL